MSVGRKLPAKRSVSLPAATFANIKRYAESQGVPIAAVVESFLVDLPQPKPKEKR